MKQYTVPEIRFTEHRLSNGLRVILHRNNRIPLTHVSLHYLVGSSYETPGMSGFAHLFEHMMFQGSENVQKNEHGRLIDEAGGVWNASTSKDRTNYYETVSSHFLDLALWLEADRMRTLNVTEENFENQRQTVIEEKKQSYDNRPYGLSFLRFDELAYDNWAYGHSVIGEVEDLERATLADAAAFHQRFYGPGNATLVIAGDIEDDTAVERVEHFFGSIPNNTKVEEPDLSEPPKTTERYERMTDNLALLPAVAMGFHTPPLGSRDDFALTMAALVLAGGDSSRFNRKFVYDNSWITGLYAGLNGYRGPQMFRIWFQVQQDVGPEVVIRAVEDELALLAEQGIGDEEMGKVRTQVASQFVGRLAKVSGVGELLARCASIYGDPSVANSQFGQYMAVTAEDIRNAVRRFLVRENRTLILTEPGRIQ